MAEIGQSSRTAEEDYIDIHMDTAQPLVAAPVEEPESDPEEGDRVEPVWGGVMRPYSEDEAESEESEEEESADGMGTTAADIIEGLTTRNEELEARVQHLEERCNVPKIPALSMRRTLCVNFIHLST